jgi:hypothetical protein
MIGMGFVQNFVGLLVTRIFLGITEAGKCLQRVLRSDTDVQVYSQVSVSS